MTDPQQDSSNPHIEQQVYRDPNGRYRDPASGRFVSRGQAEVAEASIAVRQASAAAPGAAQRARQRLLEAVRAAGFTVADPDDAWGVLVGVQAHIALESENGARATAAAKLVAQATGMLDIKADSGDRAGELLNLDGETAMQLLDWIKEEKQRRALKEARSEN